MPIPIQCPSCGKSGSVMDETAGKFVRCPQCKNKIQVPAKQVPGSAIGANAPANLPLLRVNTIDELEVLEDIPARGGRQTSRKVQLGDNWEETDDQPEKAKQADGAAAHSLGIAAMVLGAVSLVMSMIPCIGFIALPLAGLGIILATGGLTVAVVRKGHGLGFTLAGGAMSGLAMIFGLVWLAMVIDRPTNKSSSGSPSSQIPSIRIGPQLTASGLDLASWDAGSGIITGVASWPLQRSQGRVPIPADAIKVYTLGHGGVRLSGGWSRHSLINPGDVVKITLYLRDSKSEIAVIALDLDE